LRLNKPNEFSMVVAFYDSSDTTSGGSESRPRIPRAVNFAAQKLYW